MFIVIEGIDGSGKTTLVKYLAEKLPNAIVMKEDTSLLEMMNEMPELAPEIFKSFCEYVAQYSKQVKYFLDKGMIVISDRYSPSTVCYQLEASCGKFDCKKLVEIYNSYSKTRLEPDLILIPDTPYITCKERVEARGEEFNDEFMLKVKKCYNQIGDLFNNVYYVKSKNHALSIVKDRLKK
jgi:thymidylate kinase